jgi:hypothetical protein
MSLPVILYFVVRLGCHEAAYTGKTLFGYFPGKHRIFLENGYGLSDEL